MKQHKFQPGDKVYIHGWDQESPSTIVRLHETDEKMLPHYVVRQGRKKQLWIASQIRMSTKPIVDKHAK